MKDSFVFSLSLMGGAYHFLYAVLLIYESVKLICSQIMGCRVNSLSEISELFRCKFAVKVASHTPENEFHGFRLYR